MGAGVDVISRPSNVALKNPDEIFRSLIGISHFPHGILRNPVGIFIEVKNQSTTVDVVSSSFLLFVIHFILSMPCLIPASNCTIPQKSENIGTALIKAEYAKTGTEIYIKIREKLLKAVTVKMPFYEG